MPSLLIHVHGPALRLFRSSLLPLIDVLQFRSLQVFYIFSQIHSQLFDAFYATVSDIVLKKLIFCLLQIYSSTHSGKNSLPQEFYSGTKKTYRDIECCFYIFKLIQRSKLLSQSNLPLCACALNIPYIHFGRKLVKEHVEHQYSTWEISVQ